MSINQVSSVSMCFCSASDYEAIEIARRLKAYGIEPSGDKQADKTKLHEIELQKVKSNNEPTGKFLTISYGKEQEIINSKKENIYGSLKNYRKEKGNKDALKEDDILGRQIFAIIELKKQEEKDKKKSDKLKSENLIVETKSKKDIRQKAKTIQTQIRPELTPDVKERHNQTINDI